MKTLSPFVVIISALLIALPTNGESQSSGSALGQTNTNYISRGDDFAATYPELQDVASWPRGRMTNGLCCAIGVVADKDFAKQTIYIVNVVNTTTNALRGCLYLPVEAALNLSLFDENGRPVENTDAGKRFRSWTNKEVDDWFRSVVVAGKSRPFIVAGRFYTDVYRLNLADYFRLRHPGEYTLKVGMELIQNKLNNTGNRYLQTNWLPEVTTKALVLPSDISPPSTGDNNGNNASSTN